MYGGGTAVRNILNEAGSLFYEAVFLQMFLPSRMLNFPVWYVSVLIVIGSIYYYYLEKYTWREIEGLFVVLLYMFLYQSYNGLDIHTGDTPIFKIAPGVLRGAADMGLGIITYGISSKLTVRNVVWKRVVLLGFMLLIIFFFPHSGLDFVFVGLSALLIIIEFSHGKKRQKQIVYAKYLREISLGFYFCHHFVILLWRYCNDRVVSLVGHDMWKSIVLFILALIVFEEVMRFIVKNFLQPRKLS